MESVLQLLAAQLLAEHAGFEFHIDHSSKSVFPLRAYLTILRSNDGGELFITVDIKSQGEGVRIESDVVGEDGAIISDGPSLELHGELSDSEIHVNVDEWFESFERLFVQISSDIEIATNNMV